MNSSPDHYTKTNIHVLSRLTGREDHDTAKASQYIHHLLEFQAERLPLEPDQHKSSSLPAMKTPKIESKIDHPAKAGTHTLPGDL